MQIFFLKRSLLKMVTSLLKMGASFLEMRDVLAEDGEVLSGDEVVLAEAVGGGLGGHVGGTEYLPPRRL